MPHHVNFQFFYPSIKMCSPLAHLRKKLKTQKSFWPLKKKNVGKDHVSCSPNNNAILESLDL